MNYDAQRPAIGQLLERFRQEQTTGALEWVEWDLRLDMPSGPAEAFGVTVPEREEWVFHSVGFVPPMPEWMLHMGHLEIRISGKAELVSSLLRWKERSIVDLYRLLYASQTERVEIVVPPFSRVFLFGIKRKLR